MGISIGTMTQAGTVTGTQKIWRSLQALGAMAFAYSFSIILIEIQVIEIAQIMVIYTFFIKKFTMLHKKGFLQCCRTP
jgi:hypothetical protein